MRPALGLPCLLGRLCQHGCPCHGGHPHALLCSPIHASSGLLPLETACLGTTLPGRRNEAQATAHHPGLALGPPRTRPRLPEDGRPMCHTGWTCTRCLEVRQKLSLRQHCPHPVPSRPSIRTDSAHPACPARQTRRTRCTCWCQAPPPLAWLPSAAAWRKWHPAGRGWRPPTGRPDTGRLPRGKSHTKGRGRREQGQVAASAPPQLPWREASLSSRAGRLPPPRRLTSRLDARRSPKQQAGMRPSRRRRRRAALQGLSRPLRWAPPRPPSGGRLPPLPPPAWSEGATLRGRLPWTASPLPLPPSPRLLPCSRSSRCWQPLLCVGAPKMMSAWLWT